MLELEINGFVITGAGFIGFSGEVTSLSPVTLSSILSEPALLSCIYIWSPLDGLNGVAVL